MLNRICFLLVMTAYAAASDSCTPLGGKCYKTVFDKCCDNSTCDLGKHECVQCLAMGKACWSSSDCCEGKCFWFKCRPKSTTFGDLFRSS
ncbi:hypothetical protein X801_00232 [Opisthorchis viverrini]|uniref:UPF0506 domain-containing protein n=1 Tax=Opisthorchis viverrini TaxID=6198 RepID=A0A1S8XB09_OPIVI|nr:hypothetical protein X801_00232 [Opisthorchis viverrini]